MKVNKSIISLVLSGAFTLVHAQSSNTAGFDGFVSAGLGTSRNNHESDAAPGLNSGSTNSISELRSSVAYTDPSGFGVQLDQVFSNSKARLGLAGSPVATTIGSSDSAAHFFYRNKSGLLGAFVQQRRYDVSTNTDTSEISEDLFGGLATGLTKPRNLFGLEGQTFFGDLEISGQVGRQQQDYRLGQGYKGSGNLGSITMSYFLHDNWKVSLRVAESRLVTRATELLPIYAGKASSFGFQTEYRFPSSAFSVFARYDRINGSIAVAGGGFDTKDDRFLAGVKITFGSGSLRSQANGGASLNPIRPDDSLQAFPIIFPPG